MDKREKGTVEKGLVHDVKGNDDHLKILGRHVDSLEKTTMKLRQQVNAGSLDEGMLAVSYTHLTLPTIYSV